MNNEELQNQNTYFANAYLLANLSLRVLKSTRTKINDRQKTE